jgi:hypothetical protein
VREGKKEKVREKKEFNEIARVEERKGEGRKR